MDNRKPILQGTVLDFPGMTCTVGRMIGSGSNAIVYEGEYRDSVSDGKHRVLIKELFPFDPEGLIRRGAGLEVLHPEGAQERWSLHRRSFERSNAIHLRLLEQSPEAVGGNLNTFAQCGTLYSVLEFSGGRTMEAETQGKALPPLETTVRRMLQLLDVLGVFHASGYLHLDISPDNILLIGSGPLERVNLIDFNSVHTVGELLDVTDVYFSAKEGFTAPEVRTGSVRKIGPGTDLYAVASVFYTCLTGKTLTNAQLNQRTPPTAESSPLLEGIPATARAQIQKILLRGLHVLPKARYQSCAQMRADFEELSQRLSCRGVTHAALWEAGQKNVERFIRQNPSLAYIRDVHALYPLALKAGEAEPEDAERFVERMASEGRSALILGEGGIGKSTVLMRTVLRAPKRYTDMSTAVLYIPLLHWKEGMRSFLLDSILMELRFDEHTSTMEAARQALFSLLANPAVHRDGRRAMTLILLDGLNEAQGDTTGLVEEINRLSALPGVCVAITSRSDDERLTMDRAAMVRLQTETVQKTLSRDGLLLPESEAVRELLRVPMMLSLYLSAARSEGGQLRCETADELMERYLDALCAKEAENGAPYEAQAAVRLVLPAIAQAASRTGGPLSDADLQRVVSRCYRVLRSANLTRAFPQWIGHRSEMLCGDADAWHGRMVQQLLWKRLGLLVMENGQYRLPHQILQEYLTAICEKNQRALKNRRYMAAALAACAAAMIAVCGCFLYRTYFRKTAFAELVTGNVCITAIDQYNEVLLAIEFPGSMHMKLDAEKLVVFQAMRQAKEDGATICPWSGKPFDVDLCERLYQLPPLLEGRSETFLRNAQRAEGEELERFTQAFDRLLEAEKQYACMLYRVALEPHEEKMPSSCNALYSMTLQAIPEDCRGDGGFRSSVEARQALQAAWEEAQAADTAFLELSARWEDEAK